MNVMMQVVVPLFLGTTELLLIGGIALLLFGGKKLPEMMRGLGQGVREFKKGVNEERPMSEHEEDNVAEEPTPPSDQEKGAKTTHGAERR